MVKPAAEFLTQRLACLKAEAAFSSCGRYRWELHRPVLRSSGDDGFRLLLFVGLNPSTADADRDDPTLRRLQAFALDWGYHHLVVLNLFGRISASPAALCRCRDPVGQCADSVLSSWFGRWSDAPSWDLWLGWGEAGSLHARDQQVGRMLSDALALRVQGAPPLVIGTTRNGQPRHPLYVAGGKLLSPWACTVR